MIDLKWAWHNYNTGGNMMYLAIWLGVGSLNGSGNSLRNGSGMVHGIVWGNGFGSGSGIGLRNGLENSSGISFGD